MHAGVHETLGVTNGYYAKQSRKKAGLSPYEAAARLSIGVSTLYRYEQGNPPGGVIISMAVEYKDVALLYRCIKSGIVWREALPAVEHENWNQAIANLMRVHKRFSDLIPDLIELKDVDNCLSNSDKVVLQQMIASLVEVLIKAEEQP